MNPVIVVVPRIVALRLIATFLLCLAAPIAVQAQSWGFEFGGGRMMQSGSFTDDCGCSYSGGSGTGFMGSLFFEYDDPSGFSVGLKAGFTNVETGTDNPHADSATIAPNGSDTAYELAALSINRHADVEMTNVTLQPYVQYDFFRTGVFLRIAGGFGLLASSHLSVLRTVLTKSINGVPLKFQSTGTNTETIQDGDVSDISTTRYSALISAGYEFKLLGMGIAPTMTYDLPLNDIRSTNEDGWRISSLYGSIAFRFGF